MTMKFFLLVSFCVGHVGNFQICRFVFGFDLKDVHIHKES